MRREGPFRFLILIAGIAAVTFIIFFILTALFTGGGGSAVAISRDKVAVVEIQGIILQSREIIESLDRFSRDRNVKGIILRIDSPGGAVAPSQEIYSALLKIHEKGEKVVVASFGNVAASGAYYVASATDRIISNPGTITGSIGVIMELSNIEGLLEKVGVESYVIKSGEYKDIGSLARPMRDEEKKILQSVIDDVYMQFVEDVASARGMDIEKVKQIANGSVFSGRQAVGLGLVDELGSFQDAVDRIREMAKLEEEPSLIYEKRDRLGWFDYIAKGFLRELFEGKMNSSSAGALYLLPWSVQTR